MASGSDYSELQVSSNFSLLQGASHPEELLATAAKLKYKAIALTDHNSLAGVVRGHLAARQYGIRFIIGCQLKLLCDLFPKSSRQIVISALVYPTDRDSYGQLCRLLTEAKSAGYKQKKLIKISSLLKVQQKLLLVLIPPSWLPLKDQQLEGAELTLAALIRALQENSSSPDHLTMAITRNYQRNEVREIRTITQLSKELQLKLLVTNDIYYHIPQRQPLQDILTCIRLKTTLDTAGYSLFANGERYLKPIPQINYIYRDFPEALRQTALLSELASGFSLDQLRYEYPNEISPTGSDPLQYLTELSWQGAAQRYPTGIPDKVKKLLQQELALIRELNYEKYFLTCYDIVSFANSRGILCQGRGAAANSAVCYCLGITAVDPTKIDLLFARFVSKERYEPPDIDIDFEHERREEVIQYIYQKYGRERAGLTCAVVTYQPRSALKDVSKALGLPFQAADQLAKLLHRWDGNKLKQQDLQRLGLNSNDPTIINALALSKELIGFPRHLSQHVGGFIISEKPLCETVPIISAAMPERTMIEWDKNDIEALGLLKIDILALGMLTCIRKALDSINQSLPKDQPDLTLYQLPPEDPAVYQMLCQADTVGVFQVESRAQMSMLPRLRPRCFYDLVIEVAIVRPGPIQGKMVHPYLKRRNGDELPFYPDRQVEQILGKTLGIPIFQEQALRLAMVLANFSAGEAEQLRRAMATWKRNPKTIALFQARIVSGMVANGYSKEFAAATVDQLKGFSEYGFPESHAASFAHLVYASAWIKKYFPAHFAAALLNSQPLGFYAPAQIVRDAQLHGVEVRPVDINHSLWDCSLEKDRSDSPLPALRLGLRMVRHLSYSDANKITTIVRKLGPFSSIQALWRCLQKADTTVSKQALKQLAQADAFSSIKLSRREALWQIQALPEPVRPLDLMIETDYQTTAQLPLQSVEQSMHRDYQALGLSLRAHPLQFLRPLLKQRSVVTASQLKNFKIAQAQTVKVAGLVLFRQKPPTAKGVAFLTIEDETGIVNLIIKPPIFESYKRLVITAKTVLVTGVLERNDQVTYVNVRQLEEIKTGPKPVKI